MDEKLRQLIEEMPERPPRSKLEPHAEVIRALRRKHRTYQEIAAFLREHLQLAVAPSTIHEFVKTRARQARKPAAETEQWISADGPQPAPAGSPSSSDDEIRERIRAAKQRSASARTPGAEKVFHYDENEPLRLLPHAPKESK